MSVRELKNFVGGAYVDSDASETLDIFDPATGEVYATSPVSTAGDVSKAFRAASDAFEAWSETTPSERQLALIRIADAVADRAEELADVEVQNTGKPRAGNRRRRDRRDGRPDPLLRGGRAQPRRQVGRRVHGRPHELRPPRAGRRHRPGHAVELPDDDGGLEVRARDRGRQHRRAEALRLHPGLGAAARRDRVRVPAGRRLQRRHRQPRHRSRAGRRPAARHGLDHRLGAGRHGGRRLGRARPQARAPRARRQGAGHRLRRRRHRGGRRGHHGGRLLQRRPGLHGGDPPARARERARRVRGRARRLRARQRQDRGAARGGHPLRGARRAPTSSPRCRGCWSASRCTRRSSSAGVARATRATSTRPRS